MRDTVLGVLVPAVAVLAAILLGDAVYRVKNARLNPPRDG